MLGAGLDPLNKEQDFSVLAKTGKNLMAAHFVKPSATKTRYPPIINVFSRTLASPVNSSPFPLPLPPLNNLSSSSPSSISELAKGVSISSCSSTIKSFQPLKESSPKYSFLNFIFKE